MKVQSEWTSHDLFENKSMLKIHDYKRERRIIASKENELISQLNFALYMHYKVYRKQISILDRMDYKQLRFVKEAQFILSSARIIWRDFFSVLRTFFEVALFEYKQEAWDPTENDL